MAYRTARCSALFLCIVFLLFTPIFAATSLTLAVSTDSVRFTIPDNFMGLSYGPDAIGDTTQLSPTDNAMLLLLRQIGPGVLRFGGNSMDNKGIIPFDSLKYRRALDFVSAIGWKTMMGLPLGTFDTTGAKSIVSFISSYGKKNLISYEIGNEPDLYSRNGLRATTYAVTDYEKEFSQYYAAVRKIVPDAPFSGPTTATAPWVVPFAAAAASQIMLLTQHHYVEGPAGDPSVTIAKLLSPSSKQAIVSKMNTMYAAAAAAGVPARLSECNSVYSGGQKGVSDVFAAALWTADFMFSIANAGIVGVNFHGGGTGPYTPIADSAGTLKPRPEYYGMLFFKYASSGKIVKSKLNDTTVNVGAYVVKSSGDSVKVSLINKDSVNAYTITVQGISSQNPGTLVRLQAASLHSTSGITLGGDSIGIAKAWSPSASETVARSANQYVVSLPKASAAVLTVPTGLTYTEQSRNAPRKENGTSIRILVPGSKFKPLNNALYYSLRGEKMDGYFEAGNRNRQILVERKNTGE